MTPAARMPGQTESLNDFKAMRNAKVPQQERAIDASSTLAQHSNPSVSESVSRPPLSRAKRAFIGFLRMFTPAKWGFAAKVETNMLAKQARKANNVVFKTMTRTDDASL
jgi:hypothetical protein